MLEICHQHSLEFRTQGRILGVLVQRKIHNVKDYKNKKEIYIKTSMQHQTIFKITELEL